MSVLIFQNLLDIILSKKILISTLKPTFFQIAIVPYTFFLSTRPMVFKKVFYNFFYFLHSNIFLFKLFLNKVFIKYFFSFEKSNYTINLFILKLYNPFSQLRFFLFKKYYSSITIRV